MAEEIRKLIETYAIVDLETTNLPQYGKANITELSIVTISKSDLQKNSLQKTRVQNKLTLLFNPKMAINPEAGSMSALDNDILEHERPFDENSANIIINFIEHLKAPCFVAHNGNRFDFPVLKKQFERVNKELPEALLCIDSYPAIQYLDSEMKALQNTKDYDPVKIEPNAETTKVEDNEYTTLLSDGFDHLLNEIDIDAVVRSNETTPKRLPKNQFEYLQHKRRNDILGNHEESFPKSIERKARKSLFQDRLRAKPGNYKLSTIYKRLFNKETIIAHQAESDVLTLQKILQHYGGNFVNYSEIHAMPFKNIKSNLK